MGRRITKPSVSSKSKRRKANAKLGHGQTNKNVGTLRKIEKANHEELNIDLSDRKSMDSIVEQNLKQQGYNETEINDYLQMINEDID